MNHIVFSPDFAALTARPGGIGAASFAGAKTAVDIGFHDVSIVMPGAEPFRFAGCVLLDDRSEHVAVTLYETSEQGFVCVMDLIPSRGSQARRIVAGASPSELADAFNLIDPRWLVDVCFDNEVSAREQLEILHTRIASADAALMRISLVLDVDVSLAVSRLAALCDGDQTWLQ